jgi:glycine cleavage system H lipoate-binding protein
VHLGIDAFLLQILSSVQKIITPKVTTPLLQRQCFAWLQLEDEIIYLRMPIPGRIIQSNPLFDSQQIQDRHLYLSPEEDLWLLELELDDNVLEIEFLCKDDYLNQAKEDIDRFEKLLEAREEATPQSLVRRSQLNKKVFSKYLLDVSDNLVYVC